MRLRILGDHSHYHAGSGAVYRGLVRIARSKGWKVVGSRDGYDALLVNGEGTMHHGGKGFHKKMHALADAVAAGKPAYLVNTVWQDNPHTYDDILRQLSGITVREVRSREALRQHGVDAKVVPDISLAEPVGFAWFPIDFKNRPAKTDFYFPDTREFADCDHFPEARLLPFKSMSWSRAVKSLRTASYLITGRQHGVYAACKARTPFAASEGNTHKIRGLIETAGVDIPIAAHPAELAAVVPVVLERAAEFQKLFDWLERIDYSASVPGPEREVP